MESVGADYVAQVSKIGRMRVLRAARDPQADTSLSIAFLNDQIYAFAAQAERGTWATGGAERQQWLLARALASAGWSVTVGIREPLERGQHSYIDRVKFVGIGRDH